MPHCWVGAPLESITVGNLFCDVNLVTGLCFDYVCREHVIRT